ncbi:hypothetical protein D3C76_1883470 [compost metagenome]
MNHQDVLLQATSAHAVFHLLTNLLVLVMVLADNHALGSLELLHAYYGIKYVQSRDGLIILELL